MVFVDNMTEKEQTRLMKFISDHTIYINIDKVGFAYAITDLAKFVDEITKYIEDKKK